MLLKISLTMFPFFAAGVQAGEKRSVLLLLALYLQGFKCMVLHLIICVSGKYCTFDFT